MDIMGRGELLDWEYRIEERLSKIGFVWESNCVISGTRGRDWGR
jgi:hypothetical protein